jgi:putative Ca2+/H+ antiporter (TMEM165/GDT1 family)
MPQISLGKIAPSSISSGSGALKAYLDNGQQVGSLPITPLLLIDFVGLQNQQTYTFDTDLLIQFITISGAVNTTVVVERTDASVIATMTISESKQVYLPVVAGELLKLSAASSVNVRLTAVKAHVEVKI